MTDAGSNNKDEGDEGRLSPLPAAAGLLGLLVFYALSIGPVVWLAPHGPDWFAVVARVVYAPLLWFEHADWFEGTMGKYIDWWEEL